jgi:molybdate transport system substrate-binding protein
MTNKCRVVFLVAAVIALLASGCAGAKPGRELHVAAAANLTKALDELGREFQEESGIVVVPTYGATAQLEQQIENGAPVDVFLAADTTHVDQLIAKGVADVGSRAVYARGRLAIWAPQRADISSLQDLASPAVKTIGCAKPELAPYGAAAVRALQRAELWDTVEPKLVYAQSISAAKQFADSGNAAASFTALSLVILSGGHRVDVDQKLYDPINQAMCVVKATTHPGESQRFRDFLLGTAAVEILTKYGYAKPEPTGR